MLDLKQGRRLEQLKYIEALEAIGREFDLKVTEADRDIDQRSGAWHAARGKLKFDRIDAGVDEALRIRKDILSQCPELASPNELNKLEAQLFRMIDEQFQQALNSFQLPGPRALPSVINAAHDQRHSLKAKASRSIQILAIEAADVAQKELPNAAADQYTKIRHQSSDPTRQVFVSYSWDSDAHRDDVLSLATRLRTDGSMVILDEWNLLPGHDRHHFMEKCLSESDYVLIICTPQYAQKANDREGGVGYEASMITPELARSADQTKFVPVLRCGTWETSLPIWLKSRTGIDLRGNPYEERAYEKLVRHIHNAHVEPPPVGPKPEFLRQETQPGGASHAMIEEERTELIRSISKPTNQVPDYDKTPPTQPILSPAGLGWLRLWVDVLAQTAAVDNIQVSTENSAENAKLKLEYHHPKAGRRVIDPGGWLPREGTTPMLQIATTDIPNEARFNAVYLLRNETSGWCFPSAVGAISAPGAKLDIGKWRVVVSVTADNCRLLRFGVAFRICADGRLADQGLVVYERRFSDWLIGESNDLEGYGSDKIWLSFKAERLVFDLAHDCTVHRHSGGVPGIVMPRPGNPCPASNGQVDEEIIRELLEKKLISTFWRALQADRRRREVLRELFEILKLTPSRLFDGQLPTLAHGASAGETRL